MISARAKGALSIQEFHNVGRHKGSHSENNILISFGSEVFRGQNFYLLVFSIFSIIKTLPIF